MTNEWEKMTRAKEEEFFSRKEKESLERLAKKKSEKERLSPITGKPMVQKAIHGVIVDQCVDSNGIWLDAGELEQIIEAFKEQQPGMIQNFFNALIENK